LRRSDAPNERGVSLSRLTDVLCQILVVRSIVTPPEDAYGEREKANGAP
jgi:hypothetical protein